MPRPFAFTVSGTRWARALEMRLVVIGLVRDIKILIINIRIAGLAQWWERSPPTNVAWVRFPDPASYVDWVCYWLSSLLREVFLRVIWFFPLLKNQHFQIPIRSWNARRFLNEFLWIPSCFVGKQITFTFFKHGSEALGSRWKYFKVSSGL